MVIHSTPPAAAEESGRPHFVGPLSPLALALAEASERRVQDHRRVIRRHAVRHRVQRLLQVLDDLTITNQLRRLQRVSDHLGKLAGGHLLVARAVGCRIGQPDGTPNQLDA